MPYLFGLEPSTYFNNNVIMRVFESNDCMKYNHHINYKIKRNEPCIMSSAMV